METSTARERPAVVQPDVADAIIAGTKTQIRQPIIPQPTESWDDGVGTPKLPKKQPVSVGDRLFIVKGPWYLWLPPLPAAGAAWVVVTRVWVERVQQISRADCHAEGCDPLFSETGRYCEGNEDCDGYHEGTKAHFLRQWDDLWAAEGLGWQTNPWMWCTEFEAQT